MVQMMFLGNGGVGVGSCKGYVSEGWSVLFTDLLFDPALGSISTVITG